jgi:Uma2 family endonuclease
MTNSQPQILSIDEYHNLADRGFFKEDEAVELVEGTLVQMAPIGQDHAACLRALLEDLPVFVAQRALVQTQGAIVLNENTEVQPDFAILAYADDYYRARLPQASEVLLAIEIADELSLEYDRAIKQPLYARAGISDYWIFNLNDKYLEIYSEPDELSPEKFGYRTKRIPFINEAIPLPGFPDSLLSLTKIFPE